MRYMGLNEIREAYLSFFESKGHLRLPSFSLVPHNDPSILLINAGMTPLKPYFTGSEVPPSLRITTCQKCIRTPDIEQVGHTARHGTFFEMLGNFSFGDYFKKEIIPWAWEFCTDVLELDPERIHVTVYEEDDEAYDIWQNDVGLDPYHISRLGKEDNFWEHGTGPCGPCSEIFYDRGDAYACDNPDCGVTCDCDRFIEFWNLVFTQFDRKEDGSYIPLEKKNIDTGAGLERVACIVQEVDNLFEVDTVKAVLDTVCKMAQVRYGEDKQTDISIRVITDHIRSTTMMISDGILPSNEGRGYVLRRLIRRAARFGRALGIERNFLTKLAPVVIENSKEAYPQLEENKAFILNVILNEEERFNQTVIQGQAMLETYIQDVKKRGAGILAGDEVFRLHDTYGFPLDLTREIAAEDGVQVDEQGFRAAMREQREKARKAMQNKVSTAWGETGLPDEVKTLAATVFTGYERLREKAEVRMILAANEEGKAIALEEAVAGMKVSLIFDKTPFYANAGGQLGDKGEVFAEGLKIVIQDTTKTAEDVVLHHAEIKSGNIKRGQKVELVVDEVLRLATARNHTATHLLHKALKEVLGAHVNQAGSMVSPERLRFDFNHFQAMTKEELRKVEAHVNASILADKPVFTHLMTIDEAKAAGATALFDEKYGNEVRVVEVEGISKELCGGCHLQRSSQACIFKIISEASIASGVRRIEAVTGLGAFIFISESERILDVVAQELKSNRENLEQRADQLQRELKVREKEIHALENKLASGQADELLNKAVSVGELKALVAEVQVENAEALREMADKLRDKLAPAIVVLASVQDEKVSFTAMLSPEAVKAGHNAGKIVKAAAQLTGGGGGGRPDMAQAGGKDPSKLPEALEAVKTLILEN